MSGRDVWYDADCEALAEHFLVGEALDTPENRRALAIYIQSAVEDWFALARVADPFILSSLTRLSEGSAPEPERKLRFKVGDPVVHYAHGRGEVVQTDEDPDTARPYRVRFFPNQFLYWVRDDALSPAPEGSAP